MFEHGHRLLRPTGLKGIIDVGVVSSRTATGNRDYGKEEKTDSTRYAGAVRCRIRKQTIAASENDAFAFDHFFNFLLAEPGLDVVGEIHNLQIDLIKDRLGALKLIFDSTNRAP